MNRALVVAVLLALCVYVNYRLESDAGAAQPKEYRIETLFTYEGCTVYRFRDEAVSDQYQYFANCGGNAKPYINDNRNRKET